MSLLLPTLLFSALLAQQEEVDLNLADVIDRLEARSFLAEAVAEGEDSLRFSGLGSAGPELSESEVELFAADGPGILGRLMVVQPAGTLRFYFDGSEEPEFALGAREFFSLKGPFQAPMVALDGARGICRAPISFAKSIRVTTTQASPRFEAGVHLLGPETSLESATQLGMATHKPAIERIARSIASGTDAERWRTAFATGVCDRAFPFEYDINGNGVMQWFTLKFISADQIPLDEMAEYLRSMRIEFWEGTRVEDKQQRLASVPFGDFFGSAPDFASWRSDVLAVDTREMTFTARFPMPYKYGFGMRVISNRKMEKQVRMKLTIGFEQMLEPPTWRFRSGFFQKRGNAAVQGDEIALGKIAGAGRLVGLSLTGLYNGKEAWDEGSVLLKVDGQDLPSNALSMPEFFDRTTRRDGPASFGYTSRNRLWIHDPILFEESAELRVSMGASEDAQLDLEGVAYWYSAGDAVSPFPIPEDGVALAPTPVPEFTFDLEAGAVEAESMRLDRKFGVGEARIASPDEFAGMQLGAWQWSGMQDGNFAKLGVNVMGADQWSVAGRFWAYPGGPTLQLSLSGQSLGGSEVSLDAEEPGWKLIEFGELGLKPREHILLLGVKKAAQDGPGVVFDYLLMRPIK